MKKLFILLVAIACLRMSHAQFELDSVSILNSQIDSNSNVLVYVLASFNKYPAQSLSSFTSTDANIVTISKCYYCCGNQLTTTTIEDTVNIGRFSPGLYHLYVYNQYTHSISDTACSSVYNIDSTHLTFFVPGGVSSVGLVTRNDQIVLSPNPVSSLLNIQSPSATTLQLTTTDGRVVLEQSAAMQNKWEVDVSSLPKGLYFAVLQTEQGRAVKRWVKE